MSTYKRHRFPPDIISYAVWLYYRFNLSHRDIEDLLAKRGISVSARRDPLRTPATTKAASEAGDDNMILDIDPQTAEHVVVPFLNL